MPRPRDIVGLKTTEQERHEAVIRRAVEVHQPYKLFRSPNKKEGWVLVYDNPVTQSRSLIMDRLDRTAGNDIKEMLERAWAEGILCGRA